MNEGLVAKSWSDSGDVPVGEVTYTTYESEDAVLIPVTKMPQSLWVNGERIWQDGDARTISEAFSEFLTREAKSSDPNAKPSNPALCRVAGEAYRGLGWCDQEGV